MPVVADSSGFEEDAQLWDHPWKHQDRSFFLRVPALSPPSHSIRQTSSSAAKDARASEVWERYSFSPLHQRRMLIDSLTAQSRKQLLTFKGGMLLTPESQRRVMYMRSVSWPGRQVSNSCIQSDGQLTSRPDIHWPSSILRRRSHCSRSFYVCWSSTIKTNSPRTLRPSVESDRGMLGG